MDTDYLFSLLSKIPDQAISLVSLIFSVLALFGTSIQWFLKKREDAARLEAVDNEARIQEARADLDRLVAKNIMAHGRPAVTLQDVMDGHKVSAPVDHRILDIAASKLGFFVAALSVHSENVGLDASNIQKQYINRRYARSVIDAMRSLGIPNHMQMGLSLVESQLDEIDGE